MVVHTEQTTGVELERFRIFEGYPQLIHGIAGRRGGVSTGHLSSLNMGLASVGDEPARVAVNRARLAAALGVSADSFIKTRQVHGTEVLIVGEAEVAAGMLGAGDSSVVADGLLTSLPGVSLFLSFADCVPVMLFEPVKGWVGLVHAGWQGTVSRIAQLAVQKAVAHWGSRPEDVRAGIGPSIGPCCYQVGEEVLARVRRDFAEPERLLPRLADGTRALDLWQANVQQLREAGLSEEQIEVSGQCTACHTDRFFSHRGDKGRTGRMGAVIGLKR